MAVMEQHYMVGELAKKWRVDRKTITRRLPPYMHLIPDFNVKKRSRFGPIKRLYRVLRIPESVAQRLYRDIMGDDRVA